VDEAADPAATLDLALRRSLASLVESGGRFDQTSISRLEETWQLVSLF
jgi:hypothetical protein